MGGFYMKMSNVKTSTVAKSAYNSRTKEYDETQNHTFNYSAKEDHVYHHVTLPDGCPEEWKEAEKLWNENEKFETAQNTERHGKQFIIAIPQELTQEQTEKAINEFQEYFAKMGYASQADQHEPESRRSADEVEKNRHVHILTTARKITNGEFEKVKEKKVYANDVDAQGKPIFNPEAPDGQKVPKYDPEKLKAWEQEHGRKFDFKTDKEEIDKVQKIGARNRREWERVRVQDNPLDRRETIEAARAEWARICNQYLSEGQQIDHRSYERQGSDKVAQVHEGIGSHQEQDDRKAYNEQVKQLNRETEEAKKAAEIRLKEKGESHADRESETISGDHQGFDGVGGRFEGRDRSQGQRDPANSNTVRDIPGQVPGASSRNHEIDERLQRAERTDRAETASRRSKQDNEGHRGREHPGQAHDGREPQFESRKSEFEERIAGFEREHQQENRRSGEETASRSAGAYRPEEGERGSEKADRKAENTAERSRSDLYFDTHETITRVRETIEREGDPYRRADEYVAGTRSRISGIRGQHNEYAEQERRERETIKGLGAEARSSAKAVSENKERFGQLRAAFEGIRSRVIQLKEKIQSKVEEAFNKAQEKQEQPRQPQQTAQSPLSKLQQAQAANAAAQPRERSEEDMSRSGANSLLAQARAQNQAADQRERTAEKPQNDVMARFKEQQKQTEANRKEELEEVQQRTIHRGRHR